MGPVPPARLRNESLIARESRCHSQIAARAPLPRVEVASRRPTADITTTQKILFKHEHFVFYLPNTTLLLKFTLKFIDNFYVILF